MSNNTALFLASSIGWYQIEIRIIIPKASGGFQLLVRPPSSPVFITYNGFVTAGPALASGSNTSLNSPRDLLSSWDVFYNVVNVTSSPLKLTSIYNASSAFQYTLRGINPFTSSLGSSLLPVGSSMVVLGSMNSLFQPSAANATASFSITCPGCQVLLDGLVVIDSFISLISSAPPAASRSPCLGMTTDQHQLTIRFAVAFNSSMSFSLIPC